MKMLTLAIYCLGIAFGFYMLIRNEWVFYQRCRFVGTIQYHRLPSYAEMMLRFWIWDIGKFLK